MSDITTKEATFEEYIEARAEYLEARHCAQLSGTEIDEAHDAWDAAHASAQQQIDRLTAELSATKQKLEEAEKRRAQDFEQQQQNYYRNNEAAKAHSNEAVARYGYEPRMLQLRWRNDPPAKYDSGEVEAAIVDALVHEGAIAWSGDGAGCAEQIVRKQFELRKSAESERDQLREWLRAAMEIIAGLNEWINENVPHADDDHETCDAQYCQSCSAYWGNHLFNINTVGHKFEPKPCDCNLKIPLSLRERAESLKERVNAKA